MLKNNHAFSLIEMLLVLVIIGIILGLAFPSFSDVLSRNRATVHAQQIATALKLARMAAISRCETVRFCKSRDHKTCSGNWRDGQIILTQNNAVLRVFDALPAGDQLFWQSSFSKNDYLEFLPSGNTNAQQGSFYYCPKNISQARAVIIQQTGHMRISDKTAKGTKISCDYGTD